MGWMKWTALVVAIAALAPIVAGQLGQLRGKAPANLGVRDGRLKPPSKTPNSVTSQAGLWPDHAQRAYAQITPIALITANAAGVDAGAATLARLRQVVLAMPGARIERDEADYIHATFETRLLRFTDDAEFWLDRAHGVVQLRSASRLGRKDFGVNRARIEAIRQAMANGA